MCFPPFWQNAGWLFDIFMRSAMLNILYENSIPTHDFCDGINVNL